MAGNAASGYCWRVGNTAVAANMADAANAGGCGSCVLRRFCDATVVVDDVDDEVAVDGRGRLLLVAEVGEGVMGGVVIVVAGAAAGLVVAIGGGRGALAPIVGHLGAANLLRVLVSSRACLVSCLILDLASLR